MIGDPVIVCTSKENVVRVNKAAAVLLQFNYGELTIAEFEKQTMAQFSDSVTSLKKKEFSKILRGESFEETSLGIVDRNGSTRHFICCSTMIQGETPPAGLYIILREIAQSEKAESKLESVNKKLKLQADINHERQRVSDKQIENDRKVIGIKDSQIMVSNKLLEIIFSNTHFLIAYMDTEFNIIQVNDAYARAFNRLPEYFTGKNHFVLFPHEGNKTVFREVIGSGLPHITYGEPFFHSGIDEPETTYWDWSLQPIQGSNAVEGIILVLIDVTRRKKAEEELLYAKRLSDIGTLAATVAHELRNPLGVIRAAVFNIRRKSNDTSLDKHILNINTKIEESEQIINNLLSYSKYKVPKRQEVRIYDFLNNWIADVWDENTGNNVEIAQKIEKLKDIAISIDPVQITEVLNNILNNACQSFSEHSGKIKIAGYIADKKQVVLKMIDNGSGIEKKDLARIFDPFFTISSKGTGLGLTICKELLKLHNGGIKINSEKGKGTTVAIMLPLSKKP